MGRQLTLRAAHRCPSSIPQSMRELPRDRIGYDRAKAIQTALQTSLFNRVGRCDVTDSNALRSRVASL